MFPRSITASISCNVCEREWSRSAVVLETPRPYSCRFRRLPSGVVLGISAERSVSRFTIEVRGSCSMSMFGPSAGSIDLLCPRLTSADPSRRLSAPVALPADRQISPGNAHQPSRLCPPHLRPCVPDRFRASESFDSSPRTNASYAIPVRRASALPAASFRPHLAAAALAVQLTVPPVRPVEDFHLQVGAPCRAHKARPPGLFRDPAAKSCHRERKNHYGTIRASMASIVLVSRACT